MTCTHMGPDTQKNSYPVVCSLKATKMPTLQAPDTASPHVLHVAHLPPGGPHGMAIAVCCTRVSGLSAADNLGLRQPRPLAAHKQG